MLYIFGEYISFSTSLFFINSMLLHPESMCETDWCKLHSLHIEFSVLPSESAI